MPSVAWLPVGSSIRDTRERWMWLPKENVRSIVSWAVWCWGSQRQGITNDLSGEHGHPIEFSLLLDKEHYLAVAFISSSLVGPHMESEKTMQYGRRSDRTYRRKHHSESGMVKQNMPEKVSPGSPAGKPGKSQRSFKKISKLHIGERKILPGAQKCKLKNQRELETD